jgi:hypothetical protein
MSTDNQSIRYVKDVKVGDCLLLSNTKNIIISKSELVRCNRKNKNYYMLKTCDENYRRQTLVYMKYDECTIISKNRMKIIV